MYASLKYSFLKVLYNVCSKFYMLKCGYFTLNTQILARIIYKVKFSDIFQRLKSNNFLHKLKFNNFFQKLKSNDFFQELKSNDFFKSSIQWLPREAELEQLFPWAKI